MVQFFHGLLGGNPNGNSNGNNQGQSSSPFSQDNETKRVKVEKKNKEIKKRKALDTYGTNLTQKAKNNQLDNVIGRDKELQRMIQISQVLYQYRYHHLPVLSHLPYCIFLCRNFLLIQSYLLSFFFRFHL